MKRPAMPHALTLARRRDCEPCSPPSRPIGPPRRRPRPLPGGHPRPRPRRHPVSLEVFAPGNGDNAGIGGAGWFVDLEADFPGGANGLTRAGFSGFQLTGPGVHANAAPFPGASRPGGTTGSPGSSSSGRRPTPTAPASTARAPTSPISST